MPKHPRISQLTHEIGGSVFSSLVSALDAHEGETYPLHVGDTWLQPPPAARMEAFPSDAHPGLHRYAPPQGEARLRDALVEHERDKGAEVLADNLLVTAGATAGLHCTLSVLLEPGDEVLVLTPHWPLIVGIIRACRGVPVAVPIFSSHQTSAPDARADSHSEPHSASQGAGTDPQSVVAAVAAALTARTTALYLSTPNNPTGRILPRETVEALVEWAQANDLWVFSDEVYEHYAFEGEHTSAATLGSDAVVCVYSFSKSYGLAGARCGYVTAPTDVIRAAAKIGTHTFYSAPTMAQAAALAALEGGGQWLAEARAAYLDVGRKSASILGVAPPEGGTFLFLDLSEAIAQRQDANNTPSDLSASGSAREPDGLLALLAECAQQGLLLAPGPSFGPYPNSARFCFTCVEPERTLRGASLLREILDQS